ncbi:MAG: hypothetical protein MJD61_06055 [Proteobacteria bacterium]|nr:hypothetical protein [Pseudomonadota bacterium]
MRGFGRCHRLVLGGAAQGLRWVPAAMCVLVVLCTGASVGCRGGPKIGSDTKPASAPAHTNGLGSAQTEPASTPASPALPEPSPVGPAAIKGIVRLSPGAELPSLTPVSSEQQGTPQPQLCSPPKRGDRQPVKLVADRGLSGVLVALSDFGKKQARAPRSHLLVIRDCRLTPSLIAAMIGDKLVIRNETNHPFLPKWTGDAFFQTLLKGQQREIVLERGGVNMVACGFATGCGRAEVVVMYHPLHAVTDQDGRFRIDDVPRDVKLLVHAWHPLFREAELSLVLARGEERNVELVLAPALAPTAPAGTPAPTSRGHASP